MSDGQTVIDPMKKYRSIKEPGCSQTDLALVFDKEKCVQCYKDGKVVNGHPPADCRLMNRHYGW